MPSPILELEGVTLHSPEGNLVLEDTHWRLPVGTKCLVRTSFPHESSAFFRLCAGLLNPQLGEVRLGGEPLSPYHFTHAFLSRGALAWVPSGGGLLVNQNLLANVALPLRFVRGMSKGQAGDRAMDWLAQVGLDKLSERRPHSLTPQERWLGALARSAAFGAELWLVDAPQGGLSPALQQRAQALMAPFLEDPFVTMLVAEDGRWLAQPLPTWLKIEAGHLTGGSTP
ncbi:MAG: lolD [Holophagaceae bacterium]|nr:lolD [Holophagaceae bacterium]